MLPPRPYARLRHWIGRPRPGLLSALLLIATLLLAGGLAYQAARSAASHVSIARETMGRFAAFAAWQYARNGRIWVGFGMNQAAAQIAQQLPSRGPLPGPDFLKRVLAEKECDCMSAGFSRTTFRILPGASPELSVTGEELSEETRAGLIAAMASDSIGSSGPRQWRILPPGEPKLGRADDVVLLWRIAHGAPATTVGYGMVVEPAQIRRPLLGALGDTEFFPPSVVRHIRPDSVVRIEVGGLAGSPLFEAGQSAPLWSGTDTLGWRYGTMAVRASIEPDAARLLLAGDLPSSRGPQIGALLALTLAMGGGALLLLRREHRLAQLREDFVSGVSHELRTPLTQIRMLGELLESDGFKSEDERARAHAVIHREALKLTNLVDNVLEFSRLRRRAEARESTGVVLSDVIRDLAESFQPILTASQNRLEVEIEDRLQVAGSQDAISRIARNLLENAIKYGPRGQTIRLTVASAPPGTARIMVADQGPGIPAADRARIWRPYQRLERDRNVAVGGSGLGLSVVTELVSGLGGKAWVEDANPGARFVVELPVPPPRAGAST